MRRLHLTESRLHNIIKESVQIVLNEEDGEKIQSQLVQAVFQKLSQMGLNEPWGHFDTPYCIAVRDNGKYHSFDIERMIDKFLGTDEVRVKNESNLIGQDRRFVIHLPAYNHTQMFGK